MNPIHPSQLTRRVAGVLASLAPLLASITTGPAAVASPLPPGPHWWSNPEPAPAQLQPPVHLPHPLHLPPGWIEHPPLPGPAHVHAALAHGMPGWQITLITVGAAVLAAVLAVLARRMRAARRVTATTAEAKTTSGATR